MIGLLRRIEVKLEFNISNTTMPLEEFVKEQQIGSICKIISNSAGECNVNDILMLVGDGGDYNKRLLSLDSKTIKIGELWGTSYCYYTCLPLKYKLNVKGDV